MTIKIDVDPGQIKVDHVVHVIDHPNVHVFEINLDSKYPGQPQCVVNAAGDGMDVFLYATGRTRNIDTSSELGTCIRLTGLDAMNFIDVCGTGRYSARVVLYRRNGGST